MERLLKDSRYGLRALIKAPGFTAVAVLTLALGIGANAAIFSFVDGVLLKPLPYQDPGRIMLLWEKPPGGTRNVVSAMNFLDWRNQSTLFEHMAAVSGAPVSLSGEGDPEQLNAQTVSACYFDIVGTKAAIGRTFADDEDRPGKEQVVVISSRLWQSRFGADPHILGRTITLDSNPYTVIGVLPADTMYDRTWAQLWIPLAFKPENLTRNFHWLRVFARPKAGVSLDQLQAELDSIASRISQDFPDSNKGWGVTIERLADRVVGSDLKQSLYMLLAAVGFVMLIACANLANLMLTRGTARTREIAIRMALGAGRARLVKQMLTESVLLSMLGLAAGLPLGYGLMRSIHAWMPPGLLPAQADVRLDYRVLLFLLVVAVLTAVLFGIGPALQITKGGPTLSLRDGGRGSTAGKSRQRLRSALVVTEVALALVLLSGAGLVIRSFWRLLDVDLGVRTENVITMGLPMPMNRETDGARLTSYLKQVEESVRNVPGVHDVAVTSALPMQGWSFGMPFQISGHPATDVAHRQGCFFKIVSPSYFKALGMKLRSGRGLSESDAKGSLPATVINETMAARYFKDEEPVGKQILIQQIVTGKHELGPEIPWQVIGVVADEKVGSLEESDPGVYVTYMQSPVIGDDLLVRTTGNPRLLTRAIQEAVWQINRNQPLPNVKTLEEIKAEAAAPEKLRTVLLGVFAGIALLLAAIGIYGVISYSVAQRTNEMGIRAALGASSWRLLRLIIAHGMSLCGLGLVLGSAGALALTRFLSSLLFQTSPTDAATLIAVELTLAIIALAACWIPALRATRVDPVVALRYE